MSFEFKGHAEMERNLRAILSQYGGENGKIAQSLRVEAELIATESADKYVPVDLGPLRASKRVHAVVIVDNEFSVTISFGDSSAPYALAVHEHLSKYSPPSWQGVVVVFSPEGRGPKFLAIPLENAAPGMASRVAERLRL